MAPDRRGRDSRRCRTPRKDHPPNLMMNFRRMYICSRGEKGDRRRRRNRSDLALVWQFRRTLWMGIKYGRYRKLGPSLLARALTSESVTNHFCDDLSNRGAMPKDDDDAIGPPPRNTTATSVGGTTALLPAREVPLGRIMPPPEWQGGRKASVPPLSTRAETNASRRRSFCLAIILRT